VKSSFQVGDLGRYADGPWEFPSFESIELRSKGSKICICVFVLNEVGRLARQLEKMRPVAERVDVLVIDGGSTDGTVDLEKFAAADVRAVLVKKGEGKLGAQMRMAFAYALSQGYEGVVTVDGNDKDDVVSGLPRFLAALDAGYDHVQGSRYLPEGQHENTPLLRHLGVKWIHAPLVSLASGFRYSDTTNGFRAYSRRFLEDDALRAMRADFSGYELHYVLAIEAVQRGFRVLEVPVVRRYPASGKIPTKIVGLRGNLRLLWSLVATCGRVSRRLQRAALVVSLVAAFLVLTAAFRANFWGTVNEVWFQRHQRDSESLVIGRFNAIRDKGLLSSGNFLTRSTHEHVTEYRNWLGGLTQEHFHPYHSQLGLQGTLAGAAFQAMRLSAKETLSVAWLLNSMLLSGLLVAFLEWTRRRYGATPALLTFLVLLNTPWLLVFGRNLYWATWAWFLPFVAFLWFSRRLMFCGVERFWDVLFLSAFFIALKSTTGYEYLSTITVAAMVPFLLEGMSNPLPALGRTLRSLLAVGAGAVLGCVSVLFIHFFIFSQVFPSGREAFFEFSKIFAKRTSGSPDHVGQEFAESLSSDFTSVFNGYLNNQVVVFEWTAKQIIYGTLLTAALGALLLNRFGAPNLWKSARDESDALRLRALTTAFIFALFAPFSWHVLALPHSFVHFHMNYVLWSLPVTLLAPVLVGFVAERLWPLLVPRGVGLLLLMALAVAGVSVYVTNQEAAFRKFAFSCLGKAATLHALADAGAQVSIVPASNRVCLKSEPFDAYSVRPFEITSMSAQGEPGEMRVLSQTEGSFTLPFWRGRGVVVWTTLPLQGLKNIQLLLREHDGRVRQTWEIPVH
jgi:dolichol-phosphate mannosyltransferase